MPIYLYRCPSCLKRHEISRSIADRDDRVACCNGSAARRVYTVPYITPNPDHLKEGNRWPTGTSESDKVAQQKTWDRQYEGGWDNPNPTLERKPTCMGDIYQNLTQEQVHTYARGEVDD